MELVIAADATSSGKVISCLDATISLSPSATSIKALSSLCLYGMVVAPMSVDAKEILAFASKVWNKKVVVFELSVGSSVSPSLNSFKLGFECEEDRRWVLENGPWSFRGYTFALRAWLPSAEGSSPTDNFYLWIQIHNLPHVFFSVENGNRLGGLVGKVIKVDLEEDNLSSWNTFLRVLVEVNLLKPLVSGCFFDLNAGVKRWLQFKYEKIGIFCYFCGRLGHQRRGCTLSSLITVANTDGVSSPMYGPWMSIASKYLDVFSGGASSKITTASGAESASMAGGYRRQVASSVPRLAGPGSMGQINRDRGPRRGTKVMDRTGSGKGQIAQTHWVPKKMTGGVIRDNAENGNRALDILKLGEKSPVHFPISKELTVGEKGKCPLVLNNVTDVEKPLGIDKDLNATDNLPFESVDGPTGPNDATDTLSFGKCVVNNGHVGKPTRPLGLGREGTLKLMENSMRPKTFPIENIEGNENDAPNPLEVVDRGLSHSYNENETGVPKEDNHQGLGEGSLAVPPFDEEHALSHFFNAQEELLHDLKHFGKLDLYEIKKIGGDIGVPTASDTNDRTTPFKKRKFEGSASLCTRPHKIIRTHPDVVRDFPWDTIEKDRESKAIYDDPSEESSDSPSCNEGP
ncbi:hypothetical protein G4B88_030520 [Cannabis sativa]|uniref:CCHC-type domain-containing protein n=1 Tax=Cannabis sativa TaxID=3483 RepID=A0A7J6FM28_CANSA|nr:hypothetical protein G4B88_030520 [Cannabis sativa]